MKNKSTKGHRNLKMDSSVYALRRKVMGYIYEAKNLLDGNMERVDVRITETDRQETLGVARMNDKILWIPNDKVDHPQLRATVFHELLHTLKGIPHVDGCPLMGAVAVETTKEQEDNLFLSYMETK